MRLALLFACLATPLLAGSVTYDPSRFILEQGVFCEVPTTGSLPAPGTAAGQIELFDEVPEFQWHTARLPAVPGLSFGIRSEATDGLNYPGVVLTLTHPPFSESGVTRQSYVTALGGFGLSINAYTFDLEEELVTGTWVFTATAGDTELYRATFEVVPPALMPEIAAACGGLPLS
ncbi:DUF3859 domain-containing protein [Litorisediminicola beolgyonensis]|uniref:DUF3859 domain-containing protein n=1 Tax=Litorisediminicola beolgyonensis TaxID=1173614 RepID=A0ABW3ZGJ5_9RHOB